MRSRQQEEIRRSRAARVALRRATLELSTAAVGTIRQGIYVMDKTRFLWRKISAVEKHFNQSINHFSSRRDRLRTSLFPYVIVYLGKKDMTYVAKGGLIR